MIYDFTPTPLYPVDRGPRMTDRPRAGKARSWLQLDEALQRSESVMARCWKWASARGAPDVTLDVAFTMTPFGTTTAQTVTSATGKSEELVACLRENLVSLAIADLSPRTTRMRTRIAFVRASQGAWPAPPRRPEPAARRPRPRTCVPVLDHAPADQLASPVEYTIDDFDESRIVKPPGVVPTVSIGCASSGRIHTNKAGVRLAIDSNLGAMQACYAAASTRDPALAGTTVTLVVELADITTPTKVTVTGAGDQAFHDCLTAAANEIWLAESIPEATIEAHFPLALATRDAAPADPDALRAQWQRSLADADDDRARCLIRGRLVELAAAEAPWLDDRRVLDATRDLALLAARMDERDARACVQALDTLLRKIAYGNRALDPGYLRWSWIERTEALLPIAHRLDWGETLLWIHAASLALSSTRHEEGMTKLRTLADGAVDTSIRDLAETELALFDLPKHVETRHCDGL